MTHGRRLPLQSYFSRNGEAPPRCVSHIQSGNLYIYNPALPSGEYEILAFDTSGGLEYNGALFALLVSFNEAGLPFIAQPKSMGEPEQLMEWWQDIGKLQSPYWLISWRGPRIWYKSLIEPPVLGLRGWTGPKKFME